ncbi:hypothetical protein BMS3Abin08_00299 [bacterium BMS3Abin08]|nr:hypothetical protein BMS3Abin08_00299 [bacterium BMS3Abin08]
MTGFNQREYQTVIPGALLHDIEYRLVGGVGKGGVDIEFRLKALTPVWTGGVELIMERRDNGI